MTKRLRPSIVLSVRFIVLATMVSAANFAYAADDSMSPAMFKSNLESLKDNLIEHDKVVKEYNDLVTNPNREDGEIQFNKDAHAFNQEECHVYNGNYSACQWYFDKKAALQKRKDKLQALENALQQKEQYTKTRVNVLLGLLRVNTFLLGCLQPFEAKAHACAQLAPAPAYACLRELWENSGC
ncbi:MAG: hypothetical protein ACLQME_07095 [Alphaproteobacteria bacterium]